MKKRILSIVAAIGFAFSATNVNAQAFDEGKSIVTVGYGFPNLGASIFKSVLGSYPGYSVSALGPMFLKYEYALSEKIGIGLAVAYSGFTVKWQDTYDTYNSSTGTYQTNTYDWTMKFTSPAFGVRFNYHFATKDKLDPYIGIAAGYKMSQYSFTTTDPAGTGSSTWSFNPLPLYMPITVGFRYYFTDNIGLYTELGFDKSSVIQAGLAMKF